MSANYLTTEQFCEYAAPILNASPHFTARPVTPSELLHFANMLKADAIAQLSKVGSRDFTILSTRGIALWAVKPSNPTEDPYYKWLISVGSEEHTYLL